MADQDKTKPTFSFTPAPSSSKPATTSATPFGTTTATTSSSSLFGQTSSSGQSNTTFGSAFGSSTGGGLFGQKKDTPPASSPLGQPPSASTGGGLFGGGAASTGASGTSTPNSLFGASQPTTSAQTTSSNTATTMVAPDSVLFGAAQKTNAPVSFGLSQSGSSTPTAQRGLFGATTTQGSFGASTTPSGEPKQTSNIFGGGQNTSSSSAPGESGPRFPNLFTQAKNDATAAGGQAAPFPGSVLNPSPVTTSAPSTSNIFGGGNTSSSASNIFGQKSSQPQSGTSTPASTGGSGLFGNSQTATSTAPSSGGLFANATNQQQTSKLADHSQPQSSGASGARTAPTPPTSNLFSGLGSNTSSSSASALGTTPATSGPSQGGLFGSGTPKPATTSSGTSNFFGSTPAATPSGGLFAKTPATSAPAASNLFSASSAAATSQAPATTAGSSGGLFGSATATSAPSSGLFGASSTVPQPQTTATSPGKAFGSGSTVGNSSNPAFAKGTPSTSRLAHKSLDEVLTLWSSGLTTHQKSFQNLAKRVSAWDRQLVENGAKISQLYGRCFQAERDCSEVERQLTNVEHTQTEIELFLDKYEEEVDKMMASTGVGEDGIGGVDAERERTYKTAETCASRLGELSNSLTDMVDEINVTSGKLAQNKASSDDSPNGDPLRQIVGVLNSHLVQLQKIGIGAQELQTRVSSAQRETRNLSSANSLNGGRAWLDDFGSSYLGGRR